MSYSIIDTPDSTVGKLPALRGNGITGIIRYDDPSDNPNSWKQIGYPEAQDILAAGFDLGIVSEWGNNHDSYFSASRGRADALYSMRRADQRQQPNTSAVHFAVDYDVEPDGMHSYVLPFFDAIKTTVGNRFRVGCYGSGYCCDTLKARGLIDLQGWITCSGGFSGTSDALAAGRYCLHQKECDKNLIGLSVDYNIARVPDCGQWRSGSPPPPPPLEHDVSWLQAELNRRGVTPPLDVDGNAGPLTMRAIIAYIASHAG